MAAILGKNIAVHAIIVWPLRNQFLHDPEELLLNSREGLFSITAHEESIISRPWRMLLRASLWNLGNFLLWGNRALTAISKMLKQLFSP